MVPNHGTGCSFGAAVVPPTCRLVSIYPKRRKSPVLLDFLSFRTYDIRCFAGQIFLFVRSVAPLMCTVETLQGQIVQKYMFRVKV